MKRGITILIITLITRISVYAQEGLQPEVVTYSIQQENIIASKNSTSINVLFNTAPGWYIYAPTGANAAQGMIETRVQFLLPEGISRKGRIKTNEPFIKNGFEVFEGTDISMKQELQLSPSLRSGTYEIKAKIIWQACSAESCLPPVTDVIVTTINYKQN
jgi:hypothetical protein